MKGLILPGTAGPLTILLIASSRCPSFRGGTSVQRIDCPALRDDDKMTVSGVFAYRT